MESISIAEKLWLEPTMLGVTLNYSEGPQGWHYRVGIGFRSLGECNNALNQQIEWMMRDKSLRIEGDEQITLTFNPI